VAWKIHKNFLSESAGQTRVGVGKMRQGGEGARISLLTDINNDLEITSPFIKLNLGHGIALIV